MQTDRSRVNLCTRGGYCATSLILQHMEQLTKLDQKVFKGKGQMNNEHLRLSNLSEKPQQMILIIGCIITKETHAIDKLLF